MSYPANKPSCSMALLMKSVSRCLDVGWTQENMTLLNGPFAIIHELVGRQHRVGPHCKKQSVDIIKNLKYSNIETLKGCAEKVGL